MDVIFILFIVLATLTYSLQRRYVPLISTGCCGTMLFINLIVPPWSGEY
ncbi:hypothetical protein [Paenibacillus alvei]|nr:hypothetical protein [Paenibacillus alvei]